MSKHDNARKNAYLKQLSNTGALSKNLNDYIQFSFKYYQHDDEEAQSFEEWQKAEILADLNNKLRDYCQSTVQELLQSKTLVKYGSFPLNSRFKEPKTFDNCKVIWSRLRVTGRRRLIGVFIPSDDCTLRNIFYIVFLDEHHSFYPC